MKTLETYPTLVDLVCDRTQSIAHQTAFVFLKDGETAELTITYGQLNQRARAIAVYLSTLATVGDRALLVYPYDAGIDFITAFLGCLYAGIVAVPTHPPRNRYAIPDVVGRIVSADANLILTTKSLETKLQKQLKKSVDLSLPETCQWIVPETIPLDTATNWRRPALTQDNLAFLQYTSGSSGLPKGVMITHACLMHNQQLLKLAFGHSEQAVGMGWLPLFHDMGLIGNVLQALYLGTSCVLMSPVAFIQKPVRWLQAISRYQATTSGGPNFAYDLLCRYVTDKQLQQLDLSGWDVAFSGAEPINPQTLENFATKFAPCGFRKEAFYPCYGMAEATLFIAGGKKAAPPTIGYVDEIALQENRVVWADSPNATTRAIVGCGYPWLDSKVCIVDPKTQKLCKPNQVGEIWVSGAGLGTGYWNEPEKTVQTFQAYFPETGEGPFLRTSDFGFLHNNELFILGRLNDLLVFWGLNHFPEHIEQTVEQCHPAFRANSGAAFAVKVNGCDRLVVAQEVERSYRHQIKAQDVVESVRWQVFDQHFVDVYAIVLLRPGGIPKTSSGKIQRSICRDKYRSGELDSLDEWQAPADTVVDIPGLIRRYLNPITHFRRYQQRLWIWVKRAGNSATKNS